VIEIYQSYVSLCAFAVAGIGCYNKEKGIHRVENTTDLNLGKTEGLLISIPFLYLKVRNTSQKLILWKSANKMNCKAAELR